MGSESNDIIIYDGECGLCNRFVRLVLRFDKKRKFDFSSYHSDYAKDLLKENDLISLAPHSVILYSNNLFFDRSAAVIKILISFGGIWNIFAILYLIPKKIRDAIYSWIAKKRYSIFSRSNACDFSTIHYQNRFLD